MKAIFFARDRFPKPEFIGGGYGERALGLYLGYMKRFDGLYFSLTTAQLYDCSGKAFQNRKALNLIIDALKKRTTLVLAYPTALRLIYLFPLLVLLKAIGMVRVIIDVHDLPLEQMEALRGSVNTFFTVALRISDILFLKVLANSIITVSPSYKNYVSAKYNIKKSIIFVLSNSSFPELFHITPTPRTIPFRIIYLGTLMKTKCLLELVEVMRKLRKEFDLELIVLGFSYLDLPKEPWIKVSKVPFTLIPSMCQSATFCILPLDQQYLHYNITRPIKLMDYMAASRTVITTNIYESATIVQNAKAGVVIKDLEDLIEVIPKLLQDFSKIDEFSLNGRKLVENELNWNKRVAELGAVVSNLWCTNNNGRTTKLTEIY